MRISVSKAAAHPAAGLTGPEGEGSSILRSGRESPQRRLGRHMAPDAVSGRTAVGNGSDPAAPSEVSTSLEGAPSLEGKRVVICEDEAVTQMQLRRALSRAGLDIVGIATNGKEAVDTTLRERPDIVLMDIRMPVM